MTFPDLGERPGPVGALLGSAAAAFLVANPSTAATKAVLESFIKYDAESMILIAETVFERLAFDYLLSGDEAVAVAPEFMSSDFQAVLRATYAAPDRVAFAEARLLPLVEKEVKHRQRIVLANPPDDSLRQQL